MKAKRILSAILVIFTLFMLTSCGFDPDKNDLTPYVDLCDISEFSYDTFVELYEEYREENSYTHGGFKLYPSDTINMYVKCEEIVENGDQTEYVEYKSWFENNVETKGYTINANDEYRDFDKCLRYNVKERGEVTTGLRTISIGKAFDFKYDVAVDGQVKHLRFTVMLTKYKPTGKYYNAYEISDYADETFKGYIAEFFANYESNKETIEDGDYVVISYEGKLAGTGASFTGNKADNYSLRVGDGILLQTFEKELIGHKVGDEFSLTITIPGTATDKDIAGKDVDYVVKINKIYDTDKTIKENCDFKSYYELNYGVKVQMFIQYNIVEYVRNNSNIKSYPSKMIEQYEKISRDYVNANLDDFIQYSKETSNVTYTREQAFKYLYANTEMESYIAKNAEYEVGNMIVAYQIKKVLGFTYTNEDYKDDLYDQTVAESLKDGVTYTEKEIESKYTKDRLKGYFIQNKCSYLLFDRVKGMPSLKQIDYTNRDILI